MPKELILLVEDDPAVSASVGRRLVFEGFLVETAASGLQALAQVASGKPDLIILDVMLPELSGFEVADRLRRDGCSIPILMLTARGNVQDRVTGLERGADDYLVKPFAIEELLARIRALLRRAQRDSASGALSLGGLRLDPASREVFNEERAIFLTAREFELLHYFLRHPRQVLTRDQILEAVWGYDHLAVSNVIDVNIRQLREKLEAHGQPRLLLTVRGVGYVLRESTEA